MFGLYLLCLCSVLVGFACFFYVAKAVNARCFFWSKKDKYSLMLIGGCSCAAFFIAGASAVFFLVGYMN